MNIVTFIALFRILYIIAIVSICIGSASLIGLLIYKIIKNERNNCKKR